MCDVLDMNKHLLALDRALMTNQRNYSVEVQIGELMCLLGLLTGAWLKDYLRNTNDYKALAALKSPL